jgi:hypothetical protein
MFESSHLSFLAKSRIGAGMLSRVSFTTSTQLASVLEVQYSNTIPSLPSPFDLSPHFHNRASWLVGRDHGQVRWELTLQNLQV